MDKKDESVTEKNVVIDAESVKALNDQTLDIETDEGCHSTSYQTKIGN